METAVVDKVKAAVVKALSDLVSHGLDEAAAEIGRKPGGYTNAGTKNVYEEKEGVSARFRENLGKYFDKLTDAGAEETSAINFSSLSLVEEADLEAMIAMEGMVAHARNSDIREYLTFTTRLNSLFYGLHIDESNNPLDPEQIGEAFTRAVQLVGLDVNSLLIVYRKFNSNVFKRLEDVLIEANEIFIANGVISELDIKARSKRLEQRRRSITRPTTDPTERAFSTGGEPPAPARTNNIEMFTLMQNLLHGLAASVAVARAPVSGDQQFTAMPEGMDTNAPHALGGKVASMLPFNWPAVMAPGNQNVQVLPQVQLLDILTDIQRRLSEDETSTPAVSPADLTQTLGESLKADNDDDPVKAIDAQSSDIINLVFLLYKAIWQDESLPIPIKELIGRTQITIFRVALADPSFFIANQHPARMLLNELAMAGIGWNEIEKLEDDPMYTRIREVVSILLNEFDGDVALFEQLLEDFRNFKLELDSDKKTEQRIQEVSERHERLEEINVYVSKKIDERILDETLDPLVHTILKEHLHKFLVKLVVREGTGSPSWKSVINTIDVLLWTVQVGKQEEDLARFKKIAPRLLQNLGKALGIAGLTTEQTSSLLAQLKKLQIDNFRAAAASIREQMARKTAAIPVVSATGDATQPLTPHEAEPLAEDDEHLQQVERLPIGVWMEFKAIEDQSIRCTLAARIDTIDKFIFVNRQGVKVVEKNRMGLARELKEGTVKIISDGPLFDRALESVISTLRENSPHASV